MPRGKPSAHLATKGLDQPFMPDPVDQFSREGFQQKRLGLRERQSSGLKVKQLIDVQAAAGRAVPAGNVVGEDFKLRLVVHRGHIGQKHGLAKHLAIGLLRPWRDMDLALEYAGCFLVENIFEGFAAHATWRHVLDEQGRIGMFAAAEKRHAAERGFRLRALEPHKHLPPHKADAGDERETVELRPGADPHHYAFEPHTARSSSRHHRGMSELRAIAERDDETGVGLAGNGFTGRVCYIACFGEAEGCASPDHESRAGEMRGGRGRSRDMNEVDRLGDHGPRRHFDHDAVLHQSRVQRNDGILRGKILRRQQRDQIGPPFGQYRGERAYL